LIDQNDIVNEMSTDQARTNPRRFVAGSPFHGQ
jgi:hypothetical protein